MHSLQVHELKRTDVEKDLTFAGFLVISCPLKEHTKHSVKCLQDSSHHVCWIGGPLYPFGIYMYQFRIHVIGPYESGHLYTHA